MKVLTLSLLLSLFLLPTEGSIHSKDLCEVQGCSCSDDRLQLHCKCPHKEVIRIGDSHLSAGVSSPPESIQKIVIEECHHVELMTSAFNSLRYIRNVTLNKAHSIVIHPRIFNSRKSKFGASLPLENFVISNVRNLEVRRHSFEGIEIYGTFSLNNVLLKSVPSLSFSFDFVNEFEIIGSRLHRVSMWGIKLPKCHEFRSTEKTVYLSLSSHALYMSCQNFILLQNIFGSLHDASLNVSYRYAEIRKNTFETITGKPFINLRHASDSGSFIFRENKFRMDSSLPEEALSMPEFEGAVDYYIDNNHFVCDCEKLAWLIYAAKVQYEEGGPPPSAFLQELVKTSGKCLTCEGRRCRLGEEDFIAFLRSITVSKVPDGYDCAKRSEQIITEVPLEITNIPTEEFKKSGDDVITKKEIKNAHSPPKPSHDDDGNSNPNTNHNEESKKNEGQTDSDPQTGGCGLAYPSGCVPLIAMITLIIMPLNNKQYITLC